MWIFKTKVKDIQQGRRLAIVLLAISLMALTATQALAQEPVPILELTIPDTARVVDYDNGIHVVGTSGGDLYVVDEAGAYTITSLGAGQINDVRIENDFIAVAAGTTVIELSLGGLTPTELWRTTSSEWYKVVSTDLSEDGDYVCYMAQRHSYYQNAGEIGVLQGGGAGGGLISKQYTSGYRPTHWWVDATGDMEYIAASHPTYPPYYRVGIGLYKFDGSTLTLEWWRLGVTNYETTEVRISENKSYVAAATSSGTYMKLLRISDGAHMWSYNTPSKEQFACDGDDNLNYIIGANQAWSPPYGWFVLENLGTSCQVLDEGTMSGPINDLDSNSDASLIAFGSDAGEFILLRRSDGTTETVLDENIGMFIDAIEIGSDTLLVGGSTFINLYGWNRPPVAVCQGAVVAVGQVPDIDGGSWDPDEGDAITLSQSPAGAFAEAGIYEVTLTVTDSHGATDSCTAMVVVYNPSGGFVTGGGWIDSPEGAYAGDLLLTGKANFGFVSKYKKGASTPTGNTEFQFHAGDLNFHSSDYDWLVINQAGANAQFKGSGTINGEGSYKFMLWAEDDDLVFGDTFRIKIWEELVGVEIVYYDNGFKQPIGGGSIIVHKSKN